MAITYTKIDQGRKITVGTGTPASNSLTGVNGDMYINTTDGSVWRYATSWISIDSSGPFGIADSSGAYTFYSTLTLAMTAASAGQTIEMFADVTETSAVTITLKNGVNIDGHGHTYTLNVSGNAAAFDIANSTFGSVAWEMRWSNMTVIRAGSSAGGSGDANNVVLYYWSNQNSVEGYMRFNGVLFKNTGSGCCVVATGPMVLDGLHMQLANTAECYYSNSVYAHLKRCTGINTSSGGGLRLGGGGTAEYCYGESNSGQAINGGTLYYCIGASPSSGVGISSPSYCYHCIGRSSSSVGIYAINTIELVYSTGISASNYGIQAAGGSLYIKNCIGISSSSVGLRVSGDTPQIINCSGYSTSSNAAQFATNGYSKVIGGNYLTFWSNASGYSCLVSGLAVFSKATAQCTHASAYNLYSTGAVNVKVYQNSYIGGAGVHSNITNTMSNTQDNYGNITE